MSGIDEELYIKALSQRLWERKVYDLVEKRKKPFPLAEKSWKLSCCHFSLDRTNFPEMEKDLQASLIRYVSLKTGLTPEAVYSIFHDASFLVDTSEETVPKLSFKGSSATLGKLTIRVPASFVERVSGTDADLTNLLLRYSSLGIDTGMFWSLDPEIMKGIQLDDSGRPRNDVLECFASPFNYSLRHFCSPFEKDKELTYHGSTCHGDFFTFIETIESPLVLLVNPPFTDRIINKVADSLTKHFATYRESTMLVVLPDWKNEGIDRLKSLEGSVWRKLKQGSFSFYDHMAEKLIKPHGMDIIVVANVASRTISSEGLLESVAEYMEQ